MKTRQPNGGYTQVRASEALVIEAKKSWQRLQQAKEFFFVDLDEQMKENHRRFLDMLMLEERQRFLQAHPYQRHEGRVDQANGFYQRSLTTRLGVLGLQVPRSRSGAFRPQVLPRYKRREAAVDEALRRVSTRQAGPALSGLLDEAVSAATVSTVAKVLNETVAQWHRRALSDLYQHLILDGVSVRLRLMGKVQRRVVLCAYGITKEGKGELIDFLLSKAESEESWKRLLVDLWNRGLRGASLKLIVTDGNAGLVKALGEVWPRAGHQRCWVHKLRNLQSRLKASQRPCLEEAKVIYQAEDEQEAVARFRKWKRRWDKIAPRAVHCLETDLEELFSIFRLPPAQHRRLRTTNVIERLFVEVRRRIRTMCAFTTRDSCERILFSLFLPNEPILGQTPSKAFYTKIVTPPSWNETF
jgi:putative transposase